MKTLLYACSPVLLSLVLSSCGGGGNPTPPPADKPTLSQPTLENPAAEGEDLVLNFPVSGNPTVTVTSSLDGGATSLSSSALEAQKKNYVGHVTLIKQRTSEQDWVSSSSDTGDTEFTPAAGRKPSVLSIGFEDFWGDDEVNPAASSRNFTLTATAPGLPPVVVSVKPIKYRWDASIVKSVTTPITSSGGEFALNIAYTSPPVAVLNIAPGQLKVTDTVLPPLTLDTASLAANSPFWTCTILGGNQLYCKNTGVITPSTVIPPIKVKVLATAGSEGKGWTNCGVIRSFDANLQNNRSCIEGVIGKPNDGKLDFAVKKELVKPLIPGGQGAYTLTVNNAGTVPAPAPDVWVYDALPAGLTIATLPGNPVWDCSSSTATTLACKYVGPVPAQLVPGASSALTFSVNVPRDVPGEVKNCARVKVDGDVNPQNDESCIVSIPQNPQPTPKYHVKLQKSLQREPTIGVTGAPVPGLFTLTPSNAGPDPIPAGTTITVNDPMPSGLALVLPPAANNVVSLNAPNWDCTLSTASLLKCTYTGSFPVAVGAFPSVQVPVTAVAGVPLAKENCATISATGDSSPTSEPPACAPTSLPKPLDVALRKVADYSFASGQSFGFTLTVLNLGGPIAAGPLTVSDTMPGGFTLDTSATGALNTLNPSWNCSASNASNLSCTYTGGFPIASGASLPIKLSGNIAQGGTIGRENCASVSLPGDVDPSNNRACVTYTINGK